MIRGGSTASITAVAVVVVGAGLLVASTTIDKNRLLMGLVVLGSDACYRRGRHPTGIVCVVEGRWLVGPVGGL